MKLLQHSSIARRRSCCDYKRQGLKDTISEEQLQDCILSGLTGKYENIRVVTQHMFADISLTRIEDLLREYDQLLVNTATPAMEADPYDVNTDGKAYAAKHWKSKLREGRPCFNYASIVETLGTTSLSAVLLVVVHMNTHGHKWMRRVQQSMWIFGTLSHASMTRRPSSCEVEICHATQYEPSK